MDLLTGDDWEKIENRVLRNIPVQAIKTPEQLKQQLMDKFFQGRDYEEMSKSQQMFAGTLLDRIEDAYSFEEEKKPKPRMIEVSLREYPDEARRFTRAMGLYRGILNFFKQGYNRSDITRYYQAKTKRKPSTINRDIASFVKIGILRKRKSKLGRGYYDVESNVYV